MNKKILYDALSILISYERGNVETLRDKEPWQFFEEYEERFVNNRNMIDWGNYE
jgi:hypothetical protein